MLTMSLEECKLKHWRVTTTHLVPSLKFKPLVLSNAKEPVGHQRLAPFIAVQCNTVQLLPGQFGRFLQN